MLYINIKLIQLWLQAVKGRDKLSPQQTNLYRFQCAKRCIFLASHIFIINKSNHAWQPLSWYFTIIWSAIIDQRTENFTSCSLRLVSLAGHYWSVVIIFRLFCCELPVVWGVSYFCDHGKFSLWYNWGKKLMVFFQLLPISCWHLLTHYASQGCHCSVC